MERKAAEKKESRVLKRQKKLADETGAIDEAAGSSGIQIESQRRKAVSIGECEDLTTLEKMLDQPIARGKKQRIRKKIQTLKNPQDAANASPAGKKQEKSNSTTPKQKVEQLLRKREEKLLKKEQS